MSRSGAYSTQGVDAPTPEGHTRIAEGHAAVFMPPGKADKKAAEMPSIPGVEDPSAIFYNKAQVVNRDLSVCAIEAFADIRKEETRRKGGVGDNGITVLEALSATGLRALRYWHEVEGIRHIIANDLDPEAVQCIEANCRANGAPIVSPEEFNKCGWPGSPENDRRKEVLEQQCKAIEATPRGIVPSCDNAINLMHNLALDPDAYGGRTMQWANADGSTTVPPQKQHVDVVDLDPYGTAAPFLDSAISCAKEGALMLVTCTDSAILCGNYSETCHAKYSSVSARLGSCHEMAPRIVLASIERVANKHGKYIEPLVSLHIDFYVRVFVRVRTQLAEAKLAVSKLANVFHCLECPAHYVKPVGRVRPSKQARGATESLPQDNTGGLMSRKALRSERRAAAANAGARDADVPTDEPLSYPTPLTRSTPMHCTTMPIEDVPRRCHVCNGRMAIAGPIYAAPSQSPEFIDRILAVMRKKGEEKLKGFKRVQGLLEVAKSELPDAPLFYKVPDLASMMKMAVPPNPILLGAICRLGYSVSQVHCEASGVKTTAPPHVLANILRTYRDKVLEPQSKEEGAPGLAPMPERIRATPIEDLDLSYDKKYDLSSRATGVARFVQNPAFWGPLARHTGVDAKASGDGAA